MNSISEPVTLAIKLVKELKTLHADEIREKFSALGIQGIRGVASKCAISEYLKQQTGVENVSTGSESIVINGEAMFILSSEMKVFIKCFDKGGFPELLKG